MNDPHRTEPSTDPDLLRESDFRPNQPESVPPYAQTRKSAADPAATPGWERATLEKLAFAALNEQKATRRWKTFVRLAWLAFFVALVWMALHRGTPASDATVPHTAVVEIKGEIGRASCRERVWIPV